MLRKKAMVVEISLWQLITAIIAIILLIGVFIPLISKAINFFVASPDKSSINNFERLAYEVDNSPQGNFKIPFYLDSGYKVTMNTIDKGCYPQNCLCLCDSSAGCASKIYEKKCLNKGTQLNQEITFKRTYATDKSGELVERNVIGTITILQLSVDSLSSKIQFNPTVFESAVAPDVGGP